MDAVAQMLDLDKMPAQRRSTTPRNSQRLRAGIRLAPQAVGAACPGIVGATADLGLDKIRVE